MGELYRESMPKARKQHVCCECGATIDPGEIYQRVEGMWEGDFATYKTCEFCANVRKKARDDFDLNMDEGFPFEQLWDCVGIDYAGATA